MLQVLQNQWIWVPWVRVQCRNQEDVLQLSQVAQLRAQQVHQNQFPLVQWQDQRDVLQFDLASHVQYPRLSILTRRRKVRVYIYSRLLVTNTSMLSML